MTSAKLVCLVEMHAVLAVRGLLLAETRIEVPLEGCALARLRQSP